MVSIILYSIFGIAWIAQGIWKDRDLWRQEIEFYREMALAAAETAKSRAHQR